MESKMPNPTRIEVNCTTGEVQEIELTDAEVAQMEADRVAAEARKAEEDAKAQALADLKASAKAKLIAGKPLTAEEADTLVL
jgi:aconitase B